MFDPFFFWGFPVCLVLFSVVFLLRVLLTVVFAVVSRMFVGAIVVSLHFVSRVCVAGFGDSLESMGFPHVCVLSVSEFPSNHCNLYRHWGRRVCGVGIAIITIFRRFDLVLNDCSCGFLTCRRCQTYKFKMAAAVFGCAEYR